MSRLPTRPASVKPTGILHHETAISMLQLQGALLLLAADHSGREHAFFARAAEKAGSMAHFHFFPLADGHGHREHSGTFAELFQIAVALSMEERFTEGVRLHWAAASEELRDLSHWHEAQAELRHAVAERERLSTTCTT